MNFMILSMSSLFHTFIVNFVQKFQNSLTPQVAGVLFIFLWLIVSQLATKLSYRRRLDKVINMMAMRINLITLHCIAMRINLMTIMINLMTTMIDTMTMMVNLITMMINLITIRINMMAIMIYMTTTMIRSVRGHDDVRIRI